MTETEYRINPFLAVVVSDANDQLLLENIFDASKFNLSRTALFEVLWKACEKQTHDELVEYQIENQGVSESNAKENVDALISSNILVVADSTADPVREFEPWLNADWDAALAYDIFNRDWPFIDYSDEDAGEKIENRLSKYGVEDEPPSVYKTLPDATTVELPAVEDKRRISVDTPVRHPEREVDTDYTLDVNELLGSFEEVFSPDTTTEPAPHINEEILSKLLFYTYGEIGSITDEQLPHGELLLKTSPGHGSLHPIEAYPIVFDVEGVPDGVYHYSVKNHELERVGDITDELTDEYIPTDESQYDVIVVQTAIVERTFWKYRSSRSLRNIFHDTGHLIETSRLVGNSLGIETTVWPNIDGYDVASELHLDVFEEPPLLAIGHTI